MSIFIETDDVSHASPAFISRTGVMYVTEQTGLWKQVLKSWLEQLRCELVKSELSSYTLGILQKCLKFREELCPQALMQSDSAAVSAYIRMMNSLLLPNDLDKIARDNIEKFYMVLKQINIFCVIWSLFGLLPEDLQLKANIFLKDLDGKLFSAKGTVFEHCYCVESLKWVRWEVLAARLNSDAQGYFVHTADTARCLHFMDKLRGHSPTLMIGDRDAGKSSLVKAFAATFSSNSSSLHMTRTRSLKASSIQWLMSTRLEPVSTLVLSPPRGKTLTVFIEDLNEFRGQPDMVIVDSYCEFVRHLLENRMWFDRDSGDSKAISNLSMVCTMTPNNGSSGIPPRLWSKFFLMHLPKPDEFKLRKIFTGVLNRKLTHFPSHLKSMADEITVAALEVHKLVCTSVIPTHPYDEDPLQKLDISAVGGVYEGLLRSDKSAQDSRFSLIRMWFHETTRVYGDRMEDAASRDKFTELLKEQLLKHFELQVATLYPTGITVFGDFMNGAKRYEEIKDQSAIKRFIEGAMDSKSWARRRVVLFSEAVQQIGRIARALSAQPYRHLINFGVAGQGLQTLTSLVCHLYDYSTYFMVGKDMAQVSQLDPEKKNLALHSILLNIFRSVYRACAVDKQSCCLILKDEQITESTLELVQIATTCTELPELYSRSELAEIHAALLKSQLSDSLKLKKVGIPDDTAALGEYFKRQVAKRLHIALCFNTANSRFRNLLRDNPKVLKTMTVNWIPSWRTESYVEVAEFCLAQNVFQNSSPSPSPETFYALHRVAFEIGEEDVVKPRMARILPTQLIDCVAMFGRILEKMTSKIQTRMRTLASANERIVAVESRIGNLTEAAEKAEQKLQLSVKECEELAGVIETQERETVGQEALVQSKTGELEVEQKEFEELAESVKAEWAGAMGDFEGAMEMLEDLSVDDLKHIRAYYSPPPLVSRVLDAVMVMLDRDQNWPEAKIQLGNPDFIRNIVEFDKSRLTMEKLHSLKKFVQNKDFTPEAVAKYSNGARILCAWVVGLEKYGRTYLTSIVPKRDKLEESHDSIMEKQGGLDLSCQKLELLQDNLKELKGVFEAKSELRRGREEDFFKATEILERAKSVLELIRADLVEWEQETGELESKLSCVVGDSLLAAAFITYLGAFGRGQRETLRRRLRGVVQGCAGDDDDDGVKVSSDWSLEGFMGCPLVGFEVAKAGFLERDEHFTENKIIFEWGRRRDVLAVDPDDVAQLVLNETIRDFDGSNFSKLKACGDLENGSNVLRTHEVQEKLNSSILSDLSVVDFSLNGIALTDYISKRIAYGVDPETVDKRTALFKTALAEGARISGFGERIPRLIITGGESILDNSEFPETLRTWKDEVAEASLKLSEATSEVKVLDKKIEQLYSLYQSYADVFTALCELSCSLPNHQMSLQHFLKLVDKTIAEYFQLRNTGSPNSSPRRDLKDAVKYLEGDGMLGLVRHLCMSMSAGTRDQFALELCIQKLGHSRDCAELLRELRRLTRGEMGLFDQMSETSEQTSILGRLNKLSNFAGILESITELDKKAWAVWVSCKDDPEDKIPAPYNNMSSLERLVLMLAFHPDRIHPLIEKLVDELFGDNLKGVLFSPQLLDLKEIHEHVKSLNSRDPSSLHPVIFLQEHLIPDPKSSLISLARSLKPQQKVYSLQVTEDNCDIARKLLRESMRRGYWVHFMNVGVNPGWVNEVNVMLREACGNVHSGFCLWVGAAVDGIDLGGMTRNAVKVAVEQPHGIQMTVSRLLLKLDSADDGVRGLVRGLAHLHAVMVDRCSGSGNAHPVFQDADFEVCVSIVKIMSGQEQPEWLGRLVELQYSNHFSASEGEHIMQLLHDMVSNMLVNGSRLSE